MRNNFSKFQFSLSVECNREIAEIMVKNLAINFHKYEKSRFVDNGVDLVFINVVDSDMCLGKIYEKANNDLDRLVKWVESRFRVDVIKYSKKIL